MVIAFVRRRCNSQAHDAGGFMRKIAVFRERAAACVAQEYSTWRENDKTFTVEAISWQLLTFRLKAEATTDPLKSA